MDGEFPWIYVAILVISFISWIFNRIQEATAERQRAAELKRRREKPAPQPAANRGGGNAPAPPPLPEARRTPEPEPAEKPGEMLRELMESLGVPPTQEPAVDRPASRQKLGPQAKAQVQEKPEEKAAGYLSAAERAALERLQSKGAAPMAAPRIAKRKSSVAGSDVRRLLSSSRGLRQAVILKEVLDAPLSLRDESSFGS